MKQVPSLKQLEYLVSLDETGHFGKAAAWCHVTPSTLSAGIRELEGFLDLMLAERTKRFVLMTPEGKEIARRARMLLRDAEDIVSYAKTQHDASKLEWHMGVIPSVGPFLLPRVLPTMREIYPEIKLFLREEQTGDLLIKLRDGQLDIALLAFPYDIEDLTVELILDDSYQVACPPDHPLVNKHHIRSSDLLMDSLMLLEEGHCLRRHVLDVCRLEKTTLRSEFEATSLPTLVQMVASGLGVTLLPEMAIKANITAGVNVRLLPIKPRQYRQIGLVWRPSSPYVESFKSIAQVLRKKLKP